MRRDGTLLFTPRQVFLALAAGCAGGIVVIAVLARAPVPAIAAASAFGFATVVSLLLATVLGEGGGRLRDALRIVAVASLGASAAFPGWFFGPSSAYAGVLAMVLLFSGLLMGDEDTRFPASGGWFVYVALVTGQLVIAVLVFTRVLPDVSLLPMVPPGAKVWHHVAAHLTVQLIYAAAFGIGRAFHRRYWTLSEELDVATRATAKRVALLDEARAEYRRTFALGREGVFVGQQLGRYRLGALIARGGAGEIYEASDLVDGSVAAVKLLRADRLDDPAAIQAFLSEATALTKIVSPHVVQPRHVGGLEEVLPYIAMERLEGETLAKLIERTAGSGRIDREGLRRLVADGCSALEAVHRAGIVHGDVNPNNLILVGETWKLIDFGARGASDRAGATGTVRFIAPECLRGERPGPLADLYGLAASVYTAITGREPFAELARDAVAQVATTELPRDPRLLGEVDDAVTIVLGLALAPDPTLRLADATALRTALLDAFAGRVPDELRARAATLPPWRVGTTAIEVEATETGAPPASVHDLETAPLAARSRTPVPAPEPALPAAEPTVALLAGTATSLEVVASTAWQGAFADKMRLQYLGTYVACVAGALLLGLIVDDRAVLLFGWATIAAAAVVIAFERRRSLDWPWAIVAALAIGPAYIFGLHSGFVAVVTVTLFVEGSFSSSRAKHSARGWIVFAVIITHAIAFALITARVIPDGIITPLLHHTPWWSGAAIQLCVTGIYVSAYQIGRTIDRRYADLVARNQEAARDAAVKEALLASARDQVHRVLAGYAGGLFTGSTIGTYAVGRLLGRGGMGEVYVASRDGREVALKVIRSDRANPGNLRRFAREAEALLRVESPYVARVLEVGTEDGRLPYLAMELVAGASLAEQLHERERLELPLVRQMIRDVARGLADVHRVGVVHRDVKPHNLVLTTVEGAPRWKLVDFGIAKVDGATQATTGHVIVGTPAYMAPEQLAGRPADARADLYGLCLVLFRTVAGRPAFTAHRLSQPDMHPPDPLALPEIPPDLGLALRIGLATNPADRFASATDLEAAFDAAFDGRLDDTLRAQARALAAREPW